MLIELSSNAITREKKKTHALHHSRKRNQGLIEGNLNERSFDKETTPLTDMISEKILSWIIKGISKRGIFVAQRNPEKQSQWTIYIKMPDFATF